ncbi:Arm DNA-binding domain-containing protein [Burkholderia sp. MSMB175]|uniref:Arm DNA-binding domain-containing protein n=1 Tax=Burkholderia sp. MSMB175 TaxID=1086510 RepID=UPI001E54B75F|nr:MULTISPECIES: Arm DNA-binding domain-containing protein [unclassified Burkholderia]
MRQEKAGNKPTKLTDGNGLYLLVKPAGSKLWRYKYRIGGKENLFAIGEYPAVSLQEACAARDDARELVKKKTAPVPCATGDPIGTHQDCGHSILQACRVLSSLQRQLDAKRE